MISLVQLLVEQTLTPKMIILAGGAGSGKTYIIKNVLGTLDKSGNTFTPKNSSLKFKYLNPDVYVEKSGMTLGAAVKKFNEDFDEVKSTQENIIWDTTGGNVKNTLKKAEGYDPFMVMVYTHPIISVLQNFERERSLPLDAVLRTWEDVYSNIKEYKSILDDNFILIPNIIPGYEKQVKEFNTAVDAGPEALKQYFRDLQSSDPKKFSSSFSQPFEFDNEELSNKFEEELPKTSFDGDEDFYFLKNLKKEYQKQFDKTNEFPDSKFIEKRLVSLKNSKKQSEEKYDMIIQNIIDKLESTEFETLTSPEQDVQSTLNDKLSKFLK